MALRQGRADSGAVARRGFYDDYNHVCVYLCNKAV